MRSRTPFGSGFTDRNRADVGDNAGEHQILLAHSATAVVAVRRLAQQAEPGRHVVRVDAARQCPPSPIDTGAAKQHDPVDQTLVEEVRAPSRRRPRPARVDMPCAARSSRSSGSAIAALERLGREEARRRPAPALPCGAGSASVAGQRRDSGTVVRRARPAWTSAAGAPCGRARCASASGSASPGSRTVSSGSSASAVPMPTRIASAGAHASCGPARRAIAPVIGDLALALCGRSCRRRKAQASESLPAASSTERIR